MLRIVPTTGTSTTGSSVANHTADVLLQLVDTPTALGVSEIARRVGCSKSAVHRVLQSLASRGFVEQTSNRAYRLGPAAVAMGAKSLATSELEAAAAPILVALRDVTRETTLLNRPVAGGRMFVAQYESPQEVRMTVVLGSLRPWHAGASGKAMLAFLDEETQEHILVRASEDREISEARLAELRSDLVEIRARGYAVSAGERNPLAAAVAAPVFGANGVLTAAISICGPVARLNPSTSTEFAPLIVRAARDISGRMQATAN